MGRYIKAFGIFVLLVVIVGVLQRFSYRLSGKKVGVVYLKGAITEETAQEVMDLLKEAVDRPDIAGIVLRIDSPGGAVAPSQELYSYIMSIKQQKKGLCLHIYFGSFRGILYCECLR